jgi:hypothetical protein
MFLAEERGLRGIVLKSVGAKFLIADGRLVKMRRSIKLNGTVIGGIETPLHKFANAEVINALE